MKEDPYPDEVRQTELCVAVESVPICTPRAVGVVATNPLTCNADCGAVVPIPMIPDAMTFLPLMFPRVVSWPTPVSPVPSIVNMGFSSLSNIVMLSPTVLVAGCIELLARPPVAVMRPVAPRAVVVIAPAEVMPPVAVMSPVDPRVPPTIAAPAMVALPKVDSAPSISEVRSLSFS